MHFLGEKGGNGRFVNSPSEDSGTAPMINPRCKRIHLHEPCIGWE